MDVNQLIHILDHMPQTEAVEADMEKALIALEKGCPEQYELIQTLHDAMRGVVKVYAIEAYNTGVEHMLIQAMKEAAPAATGTAW